jgi:hypothetical protein
VFEDVARSLKSRNRKEMMNKNLEVEEGQHYRIQPALCSPRLTEFCFISD